jgi:STE24 endopeptidase
MPFSLLLAIFVAFGFELRTDPGPAGTGALYARLGETLGAVAVLGLATFGFGQWIKRRVGASGGPTARLRRIFVTGSRVIEWSTLVTFAWIIHVVGWPAAVERGFGLRDAILIDEFLILLPYLLALFLEWLGLYPAERALRPDRLKPGRGAYLVLRARQALGLVLPVALVFSLGQDLLRRFWPELAGLAWVELAWMAFIAALVLVCAPAFVRLTWPTHPLPSGPLRERLERLSRRFGFRCTDILVWETGQALVNAGVTGALPSFRYVFLTDALIDNLNTEMIEAVYGHEVGHVVHRHMVFFGFFFLGSVAVLALVYSRIANFFIASALAAGWWPHLGEGTTTAEAVVQLVSMLLSLGLYFLVVFGFLSRRFERQADVFGCRVVSCGRPDCPPHADLNKIDGSAAASDLCPSGIRIFAGALSRVATLNGMEQESLWAWRHGSIARRIRFLESLAGRPEAERVFQRRMHWLRWGLTLALSSAVVFAAVTGALSNLP